MRVYNAFKESPLSNNPTPDDQNVVKIAIWMIYCVLRKVLRPIGRGSKAVDDMTCANMVWIELK